MATAAPKAGKYELLADAFQEYDESKTPPVLVATYAKGDIVSLNAEQAERLTTGDSPAFAEPGALAQAEADRLQAQADAAKAAADAAKARAAEASKDAKAAGSTSTRSGGDAPAGNASLEDWHAYALTQGASEADLDGLGRDEIRDLFKS